MRSRISSIIILGCIVLLLFATIEGIAIWGIEVISISQLLEKDQRLNEKIQETTELTSIEYADNIKKLEEKFEEFQIQKQNYEELVGITNENNKEIYETKQYDIEYLWRLLGKYAEQRGISLKLDIKKDNKTENSYNFNFTIEGNYINISQFMTDIENNSDLYFRIYNFKMTGKEIEEENEITGENEKIIITVATFTVKNVNIDPSTVS